MVGATSQDLTASEFYTVKTVISRPVIIRAEDLREEHITRLAEAGYIAVNQIGNDGVLSPTQKAREYVGRRQQ